MTHIQITCPNEVSTRQLGETLALVLRSSDLVTLAGDLGTGKTTLARALIRSAASDADLEVPSPTFTLVQTYENLPFGSLAHIDLYRLEAGSDIDELGVDDALGDGVVMVEWPDKASGFLPKATLEISIEQQGDDDQRLFDISGNAQAIERLQRSLNLRKFLDDIGHANSSRHHLIGDASTRSYETVQPVSGENLILMNSPEMPDGPPIRDGLPYSKIAHLAENVRPFVGLSHALEKQGFRAPHIHAMDLVQGILLIEDLGRGSILTDQRQPILERYQVAVETLASLHEKEWVPECPLPDGPSHIIPPFDRNALLIEVDLLPQWYALHQRGEMLSELDQEKFEAIWNRLIDLLEEAEKSLTLRDFHSPNIIWVDEAQGSDRIGIIDFQDAMIGPTAYDLASIAQDARVTISAEMESELVSHYCSNRTKFDENSFRQAYAIMAAQRATKLLGIFVRLSKRDGKHAYLAHLPRIQDYLARSLVHPVLDEYQTWVETVLKK